MASRGADTLREAAAALASADYRGAIRLCEQVRSLERVSEDRLVRVFELLGRAFVGLGDHETALSYLKRADRNPETLAAVRVAFEALGYEDDPRFFEQAEIRAKKKRRRRIGLIGASVVVLPFVLVCGGVVYSIGQASWAVGQLSEASVEAAREGAERGRAGNVGDCVEHAMAAMVRCAPNLGRDEPELGCLTFTAGYASCLSTTRWNEYCENVPAPMLADDPPAGDGRVEPWAEEQCTSRAEREGLAGQELLSFRAMCETLLSDLPAQCADPSLRPVLETAETAPAAKLRSVARIYDS